MVALLLVIIVISYSLAAKAEPTYSEARQSSLLTLLLVLAMVGYAWQIAH